MNAAVIDAYGGTDRLELREVEQPRPGPGQLRIKVRAASVNPIDWKMREGHLRLLIRLEFPAVLGVDVAGVVEEIGPGASRFRVGDPVFAMLDPRSGRGSYAEQTLVDESAAAIKPDAMTFEQAAAIPCAGLTALQSLRDLGKLPAGGAALINGASGGVGSFAVQIARALGATAAGVCGPTNLELVRDLGAQTVIDYAREDFTRRSERYDVVLDAVARSSFAAARRVLKPGGVYVSTLPTPGTLFWSAAAPIGRWIHGGRRARLIVAKPKGEDLATLARMVEEGQIRPLIDRTFPLDRVREAHELSQTERARGKIVLSVS